MRKNTKSNILEFLKTNQQATAAELVDFLEISRQALFKHLKKLLEENQIYKIGKPPKVFYFLKEENEKKALILNLDLKANTKKVIEDNFLTITPQGEYKQGLDGFVFWCKKSQLPIEKTAQEYLETLAKYNQHKQKNLIDGISKLKSTFSTVFLNKLYYLDFYTIERFGKTKLGTMLLYAKQSQNKKIIKDLIKFIQPQIESIIKKHKINAVGFIPPTIKRDVQFMKELEKNLKLQLPKISIVKIKTEVVIPQKTLNKLEDRIENARNTIIVNEKYHYQNILLLDDAIGSGATINETAGQISKQKIAKSIIGLAITGSFKGFDIISEV